ncbi:hypothetical protein WA026_000206 [Henosepilachna vigintioctopunctata]|uniref:Major facilitator superfamily (MFS) profile domain-containing protein n=1 Tax=Henosepilachna vigintioctopunctata TaxID=420089 RepID=A0AAW1UYI6_9CUCU
MAKCCYFPQRAYIALMLFTACAISYMLRVNMSINIIAMAKEETKNSTDFVPACKAAFLANLTLEDEAEEKFDKLTASKKIDEDKRYDWDPQIQAIILGAYFWGQIVSCAPGGLVAERFGATRTVFISTIIASICTFFIPVAALLHWSVVWVLRFVTGVMGGVVYPSLHCLISRWAPPEEKGKFIGALLGGSLGTVLTWPLLGIIIEKCGWPASFFIPSAIALLWSLLWYYVVSDSPGENKWISEGERSHIQSSLKGLSSKEKSLPPYKEIFTSIAVWAFIISHFGNSWGLFFLMTSGPKYMSTILGFNLSSSGFLSAMPYMARMIFGFIFGFFGDIIRKNNWMAPTVIRKCFTSFSHIIPGIFLLLLTTTECNIIWTVTLITFSLGINGASSITNLANAQDLAPAYAGSLYGIANTIGGTTGFISPVITGYLTKEQNGIYQWRIIFFIGGSVYILSGIVFLLFGSGENQNFNSSSNSQKKTKTSGIDNTAFENDESKNSTTNI